MGNFRPSSLLHFIIIPQAILLTAGTAFIVCGFISLLRIRNTIKKQSTQISAGNFLYIYIVIIRIAQIASLRILDL